MTNLLSGWITAPFVKPRRKSKKGSPRTTLAQRVRARSMSILRGIGMLAIGAGILMLATGVRPPFWPGKSPDNDAAIPTRLVQAPKPAAKICSAPQTDTPLFATCASFWVDYSSQKKKPIDRQTL